MFENGVDCEVVKYQVDRADGLLEGLGNGTPGCKTVFGTVALGKEDGWVFGAI